jgi:RNA polymerase sigma factor (sigma-70 family)
LEPLQDLIKGCIDKNQHCQRTLYKRFYGYALKIVFRYIFQYDIAVDVVNDGFVKVFNNFYRFRTNLPEQDLEKLLMGWMKKIMINTAIDELRRNQMVQEHGEIREDIWDLRDKGQTVEQMLLYKDLVCEIKRLPPSYRIVFNMFAIDGYTHQEIANITGISVGTSKSSLSKAKAHLQKYITDKFPGGDIWK